MATASLLAMATASPISTRQIETSTNGTYHTGDLQRWSGPSSNTVTKRDSPIFTYGDEDDGGLGVTITNAGSDWAGFYMYANSEDTSPYKYTWIENGNTVFISVPADFQGRITRGTDELNLAGSAQLLGTWFEFSIDPGTTTMWADVSLIKGCDGAVTIANTDGQGLSLGFTQDIVSDGPAGAYQQRPDGNWVLGFTEADGDVAANTIALDWEVQNNLQGLAYVDDTHGSPVINSLNGRFDVTFYQEVYV